MNMTVARVLIVLIGISIPYLARLPGGADWLAQYTDTGVFGWLFLGAFNAIAWGALLALTVLFKRPASVLPACLLGFGFLAWAHHGLDLAADAQAAIGLIFIPVFALAPIAIGAVIGFPIELKLKSAR